MLGKLVVVVDQHKLVAVDRLKLVAVERHKIVAVVQQNRLEVQRVEQLQLQERPVVPVAVVAVAVAVLVVVAALVVVVVAPVAVVAPGLVEHQWVGVVPELELLVVEVVARVGVGVVVAESVDKNSTEFITITVKRNFVLSVIPLTFIQILKL